MKSSTPRTFDEWRTILVTTKGVWSPIQHPEEIFDDPQTTGQRLSASRRLSDGYGAPTRSRPCSSTKKAATRPPAPDFGQHTDEVLREIGIDGDEVRRYDARGSSLDLGRRIARVVSCLVAGAFSRQLGPTHTAATSDTVSRVAMNDTEF